MEQKQERTKFYKLGPNATFFTDPLSRVKIIGGNVVTVTGHQLKVAMASSIFKEALRGKHILEVKEGKEKPAKEEELLQEEELPTKTSVLDDEDEDDEDELPKTKKGKKPKK